MGPGHILILAGGKGTRIKAALGDTPKALAPINGTPFLEILLAGLARQGARRITLLAGVGAAQLEAYLVKRPADELKMDLINEPRPLGTGGAIINAFPRIESDPFLVLNGDTWLEVQLTKLVKSLSASPCWRGILAAVRVDDASRFGTLNIDPQGAVTGFNEKQSNRSGYINGGAYGFKKALFANRRGPKEPVSLEYDLLPQWAAKAWLGAVPVKGRFLDIGTPESLAQAGEQFRRLKTRRPDQ